VSMDNSSAFYVNMKEAAGLFQATPTQIQSSGNFFVNYQTCKSAQRHWCSAFSDFH